MNKRLTKHEAIELVARGVVRDGKLTEAGRTLMLAHQWLVRKLATEAKKKWRWPDLDELEGEATEALIDAIMNLKSDSENPTSYIWTSIDGQLKDWRTKEADKQLEFEHDQLPDEGMTIEDGDGIMRAMAGENVKKQPPRFIGGTDNRARNKGRTDTADAMRAFPNRTQPTAQNDAIATEQWDQLEAMNNSDTDFRIIRLLRKDHTLTVEELADIIRCSKSTVYYRLAAIRERAVALRMVMSNCNCNTLEAEFFGGFRDR